MLFDRLSAAWARRGMARLAWWLPVVVEPAPADAPRLFAGAGAVASRALTIDSVGAGAVLGRAAGGFRSSIASCDAPDAGRRLRRTGARRAGCRFVQFVADFVLVLVLALCVLVETVELEAVGVGLGVKRPKVGHSHRLFRSETARNAADTQNRK